MSDFVDPVTGRCYYETLLNRGNSFKERLAALRKIDEIVGVETIPDDLESITDELLLEGTEEPD